MCVCVCVCVCMCVCVCLCARARVSVCARTLKHSLSDGQRKTANDNYNQHLKAKALRDTYTMQTLRRPRGGYRILCWGGGGGGGMGACPSQLARVSGKAQ